MYKQIRPLQPSGKMAVTPEQSAEVQKVLFEMGFEWYEGKTISWVKWPYIFWNNAQLANPTFKNTFEVVSNPLHTFTDYFETLK